MHSVNSCANGIFILKYDKVTLFYVIQADKMTHQVFFQDYE